MTVSATLVTAFRAAAESAHRDGIVLEPEHFLRATLTGKSAATRILRLLSTITRRRQALTDRALLYALAGAVADGQRPSIRKQSAPPSTSDSQRRSSRSRARHRPESARRSSLRHVLPERRPGLRHPI
jgi:hypothetical protein